MSECTPESLPDVHKEMEEMDRVLGLELGYKSLAMPRSINHLTGSRPLPAVGIPTKVQEKTPKLASTEPMVIMLEAALDQWASLLLDTRHRIPSVKKGRQHPNQPLVQLTIKTARPSCCERSLKD